MADYVNGFIAKNKTVKLKNFVNEIINAIGTPIHDDYVDNKYVAYYRGDDDQIYMVQFVKGRAISIERESV